MKSSSSCSSRAPRTGLARSSGVSSSLEDALLDELGLLRDVALGLPYFLALDVPEQGAADRRDDGGSRSGEPQMQAS